MLSDFFPNYFLVGSEGNICPFSFPLRSGRAPPGVPGSCCMATRFPDRRFLLQPNKSRELSRSSQVLGPFRLYGNTPSTTWRNMLSHHLLNKAEADCEEKIPQERLLQGVVFFWRSFTSSSFSFLEFGSGCLTIGSITEAFCSSWCCGRFPHLTFSSSSYFTSVFEASLLSSFSFCLLPNLIGEFAFLKCLLHL